MTTEEQTVAPIAAPALTPEEATSSAPAEPVWARHEPKGVYTTVMHEDDRGLVVEQRHLVVGDYTARHPRFRMRIVIEDEDTHQRFVHWEPVEAETVLDVYAAWPSDRVEHLVGKLIEDMKQKAAAQAIALQQASRRLTGKGNQRSPIPGNFKNRGGRK